MTFEEFAKQLFAFSESFEIRGKAALDFKVTFENGAKFRFLKNSKTVLAAQKEKEQNDSDNAFDTSNS